MLTMLGIIIGIASVIAIVTIGDTLEASVNSSLSSLGTTNITVAVQERGEDTAQVMFPGAPVGNTSSLIGKTPASSDLITEEMIHDFSERYQDVIQGVSIQYASGNATVKDRDLYANISITGINEDYEKANSLTMLEGRGIDLQDVTAIAPVAVVSDKLVSNLFPSGEDVLGKTIKVYKPSTIEMYTIIGVYEYVASGFGGSTASDKDMQTSMYVPLSTAKKDVIERNHRSVTIIANTDGDVSELTDRFQSFFDGIYAGNKDWKASVTNMTAMVDTMTTLLDTITLAIAFIAAISLLVGGIGVMNIMLVSVTERTKEIGTRKALGAKTFHIQLQFLIEAVIVTVIGGVIGIILGVGIGYLVSLVLGVGASISVSMIALSFLFSMAIGVFFGLYPASKAAKLDPIVALRYE